LSVRVPSREDWLLNTAGAAAGAVLAVLLARLGAIDRWSQIRARWFGPESRGGIVLLALWPMALLFPAAVPFGLGQVLERVEETLGAQLVDTPFLDWLPVRETELQPLVPGAEMVCVMLGLLIPCLLAFCVIRSRSRRALFVGMMVVAGVAVTALSAALSWGPTHAWAWLSTPVQFGMVLAGVLALVLALVPWRASASLLLLSLGVYLSLLNQAPESPYFAQTLHAWEQGRFIRFHGLAQWLGWHPPLPPSRITRTISSSASTNAPMAKPAAPSTMHRPVLTVVSSRCVRLAWPVLARSASTRPAAWTAARAARSPSFTLRASGTPMWTNTILTKSSNPT
jgi:hypothetical protein